MSKTMTDVLAAHRYLYGKRFGANRVEQCSCGWQTAPDTEQHAWESLAAHQAAALSAAGFGLVADTKAEGVREAAAAGLRAVCDVWGAGGRATVRLSELSEIAKDITEGEWDQHIEWNLKDIARERARATKAAS